MISELQEQVTFDAEYLEAWFSDAPGDDDEFEHQQAAAFVALDEERAIEAAYYGGGL